MATITTDTYLDGGTARTAGESWNINGCILTVRTDTRWHANAPASMTGSLGTCLPSNNLGGTFKVDGTKVRWVAFTSAGGTVPTIGSTCSLGPGVGAVYNAGNSPKTNPSYLIQGYVLGVYASISSAPSSVGSVMPSSGFIKFREVTNGPFPGVTLAAGDYYTPIFSNGITTIQMLKEDVAGWIEVVFDSGNQIGYAPLGQNIFMQGEWFYLDNTTGTPGQVFQFPTNGGGAGTTIPGIQIETSPGSNVFEWYPTIATTWWTTTYLTTDIATKFAQNLGSGQIRIGSDGTTNIGFTPQSGCKTRIGNIFLRDCSSASRSANLLPPYYNSRSKLYFYGKNYIDKICSNLHADGGAQPTIDVQISNSAFDTSLFIGNAQSASYVNDSVLGNPQNLSQDCFKITNMSAGNFSSTNLKIIAPQSRYFGLFYCGDMTITNCEVIGFKNTSSQYLMQGSTSQDVKFVNLSLCGGKATFGSGSSNITFTNTDYIDRLSGNTTTSGSSGVIDFSMISNLKIDGLTFGKGGLLPNRQCTGNMISLGAGCDNVKIYNIGTPSTPLNTGTTPSLSPYGFVSVTGTPVKNIFVKRCYISYIQQTIAQGSSSTDFSNFKHVFENVFTGSPAQNVPSSTNGVFRGNQGILSTSSGNANGLFYADIFHTSTTGSIFLYCNGISANSSQYVTESYNVGSTSGIIASLGRVALKNLNEYVIYEQSYFAKGHISLANLAPVITGGNTTYMKYEYQIDKGVGWNGTWTLLTQANLYAESGIDPSLGVKFKIRITCTIANVNNYLSSIQIKSVSSAAQQLIQYYPLDTNTLSFTGLAPGSEVRCYQGTDPATSVEIGGIESTSGSTFSFTHSSGDQDGYITILAMGFQPVRFNYTFKSVDESILIQPVVDRNYVNPA